jgi:hypothetical protein
MSPETETIDGIDHRNVWLVRDARVSRDARELGPRIAERLPLSFWGKNLSVVSYKNDKLVAMAQCEIRYAERVHVNMAYVRTFVAPDFPKRDLDVPLVVKSHEIMRQYALDNPDQNIGGTIIVVIHDQALDRLMKKMFLTLAGYTPREQPLLIRWFDHFRIDDLS